MESKDIVAKVAAALQGCPVTPDLTYHSVMEALLLLVSQEEDSGFDIRPDVFNTATFLADELRKASAPTPKIFTHGRNSVVLTWEFDSKRVYLTIGATSVSFLEADDEIRVRWSAVLEGKRC